MESVAYSQLFEKYQSLMDQKQSFESRLTLKKELFRREKEYRDSMASMLCYHLNLENPRINESVYYLSAGLYHELDHRSIKLWI